MNRFEGKVIIVTGGANGLGEAAVIEFVKEGGRVAIADINEELGNKLSESLNSQGYETLFVKTDVSKEDDMKQLVERTVEHFGKLDVMHANAGINIEADIHELSAEKFDKVIAVNLRSVYLSNKYATEQFLKQGTGGAIVNTGSIHSLVARNGLAAYATSKGGVKMLTQQMASRYSKDGIRTNAIAPGYIHTSLTNTLSPDVIESLAGLHPMGRMGEPIEVARAVLFLASDEASFISGVVLPIDGAYSAV